MVANVRKGNSQIVYQLPLRLEAGACNHSLYHFYVSRVAASSSHSWNDGLWLDRCVLTFCTVVRSGNVCRSREVQRWDGLWMGGGEYRNFSQSRCVSYRDTCVRICHLTVAFLVCSCISRFVCRSLGKLRSQVFVGGAVGNRTYIHISVSQMQ
jgi:hypothetical protein